MVSIDVYSFLHCLDQQTFLHYSQVNDCFKIPLKCIQLTYNHTAMIAKLFGHGTPPGPGTTEVTF